MHKHRPKCWSFIACSPVLPTSAGNEAKVCRICCQAPCDREHFHLTQIQNEFLIKDQHYQLQQSPYFLLLHLCCWWLLRPIHNTPHTTLHFAVCSVSCLVLYLLYALYGPIYCMYHFVYCLLPLSHPQFVEPVVELESPVDLYMAKSV